MKCTVVSELLNIQKALRQVYVELLVQINNPISSLLIYYGHFLLKRGREILLAALLTISGTGKDGLDIWWMRGGGYTGRRRRIEYTAVLDFSDYTHLRGEMDGAGRLAFSWTFPTCLKTGQLNKKFRSVPWVAFQLIFCCRSW